MSHSYPGHPLLEGHFALKQRSNEILIVQSQKVVLYALCCTLNLSVFLSCRPPLGIRSRRSFFRVMGSFSTGGLKVVPPSPPSSTNKRRSESLTCRCLRLSTGKPPTQQRKNLMGLNTLDRVQVKTVVKSRGQHIANWVYIGAKTIIGTNQQKQAFSLTIGHKITADYLSDGLVTQVKKIILGHPLEILPYSKRHDISCTCEVT